MVSIADVHIMMLAVFYKVLNTSLGENSNDVISLNNRLDIEDIKAAAALG